MELQDVMPLQQQVDTTSTGLTVLREFQPDQKMLMISFVVE